MQTPRTMTYAVALAAAAALTLAGCNGGDKDPTSTPTPSASPSVTTPPSSTSPSSSPSASATPAPTAPVVVPAAARAHTEAGAIAFAKFYVLEADKAFVSVDSSVLSALAGPSCEGCDSAIKGVAQFKADGERQARPSMTVLATNALPSSTADVAQVQVQVRAKDVDIVNAKGTVVGGTNAGDTLYRLAVRWTNGSWTAADMALDQ